MDWWSNHCGINSQYIFFSSYTYRVSTLGSAPSSSGTQLGSIITGSLISVSAPGNIMSITLTTGSWLLFSNLYFPICTTKELSISATSGNVDQSAAILFSGAVAGSMALSRAVNVTSTSQIWYLVAITSSAVTTQNTTLYAVRIG